MRYHYEKPSIYFSNYGIKYTCNHPIYSKCTRERLETYFDRKNI